MAVRTINIYTCDTCKKEKTTDICASGSDFSGWIVVIDPVQHETGLFVRHYHFCSEECCSKKYPEIEFRESYLNDNKAYAVRY